jgi:hypothetical protein
MPADDKMMIDERRKYLRQMQKRYREADRSVREQLLDEMGHVIQLHRKSLIRLMGSDLERQPRREQRGRTYGPGVVGAVQVIAESLNYFQPVLHQVEKTILTLEGRALSSAWAPELYHGLLIQPSSRSHLGRYASSGRRSAGIFIR